MVRIDPIIVQVRRFSRLRPQRLIPHTAGRRLRRFYAYARRQWRRSLQFRVVGITLLLSAILVSAFGYTVASLISQGVLTTQVNTSRERIQRGAGEAARQLEGYTQADDPGLPGKMRVVATDLSSSMDVPDSEVILLRHNSSLAAASPDTGAAAVMQQPSMRKLRESIVGSSRPGIYQQIETLDVGQGPTRFLVLGTPILTGGEPLELYYLLPLKAENDLVEFVALVVTATGVALVALLALIAATMTRLVVKPVRVAARTAQRLSAGLLDQRMQVKGEDDLARLAAAFNQMAANLQRQIVRLEEMSRLQRRFTSDVSHELRTPLTTVRMAADLLFASVRTSTRPPRAAPSCCRPSWTGSRTCSPTCWRSAASTPGSRPWTPSRPTSLRSCAGSPSGSSRSPSAAACR